MPEIKGKSGDRKNATIDLDGSLLIIKVKPGMFSGKAVTHRIPMADIVSIESKTGVKPFPNAQWILVGHPAGSVEFFTVNKEPLKEIVKEISEHLEARAIKLKEDEELFGVTRESHLALIVVNLELIDSLMRLVIHLNGTVDWVLVEHELVQSESIISDRVNVPHLKPATFNSRVLRKGVEKRLPYVIKQEIHDILSLVSQEAAERSVHLTSWFPSDFHNLFIESSMTLWNLELAKITGVESVEEPDKAQVVFDSLHRAMVRYIGDNNIKATLVEEMESSLIRSTLYRWTDLLLEIPFSQDKE